MRPDPAVHRGALRAAVLTAAVLLAGIAAAQGADCLVSGPATTACGTTETYTVTLSGSGSSFDVEWSLVANQSGATPLSPIECTDVLTCSLAVAVGHPGSFKVKAKVRFDGHTRVCSLNVTVTGQPLTIACPPNATVECATATGPPATGTPSVTGGCGAVTVTHADLVTGSTCSGPIISRTWTATDAAGTSASCFQTIIAIDTIPPVITCPPMLTFPCGTPTDPSVTGFATATDNCGAAPVITYSDFVVGNCPIGSIITRTWTAADDCNTSSCAQQIHLIHPPPLNPLANATSLGGGCGGTPPTLTSTLPQIGHAISLRVDGAPPFTPVLLAAEAPTFIVPVLTVGSCVLWIHPETALGLGPFVTDALGRWSGHFPQTLGIVDPITIVVQAAVLAPGSPLGDVQITNGMALQFHYAGFCTAAPADFGGSDIPGQVFDFYYTTAFAGGLTIGVFDLASGQAPPNGIRWNGDQAGHAALKTFLTSPGGPSGALFEDALNPAVPMSGGSLAIETAALTLNLNLRTPYFPPSLNAQLYYGASGDALNGLSVMQILGVANQALAGLGLPAGYSFEALAALVAELNLAFLNCVESRWAGMSIFAPVY